MLGQRFSERKTDLGVKCAGHVARGVWITVIICIVFGCGYKTRPRPATQTVPGEIGIMDARVYPERVVLRWDVPTSNTDGSAFTDISGFKVYRLAQRAGEECENCDEKKGLHANVDFSKPSNAVIEKGEVIYTDTAITPDNIYTYSVSSYNLQGKEGPPSQDLIVEVDEPLAPPENVRVDYESDGVELRWDAPVRPAGIRVYRVYRGESERSEDLKPIGSTRRAETYFADKSAEQNKTYYYQVRSVKMSRGIPMESLPSPALKADLSTAHRPRPEDVELVPRAAGIRIVWKPVRIAGEEARYNVYRSESDQSWEKINVQPLRDPVLIDRKVTRGKSYRYAVTALPRTKPDEESSRVASNVLKFNP